MLLVSLLAVLLALGTAGAKTPASRAGELTAAAPSSIAAGFRTLPIVFEANHGQADQSVRFLSRGSGHTLFLTDTEAVLVLAKAGSSHSGAEGPDDTDSGAAAILRMRLAGANRGLHPVGLEKLPGTVNYLIGDDPARWQPNVPTYARVRYPQVYPGVDLIYHGTHGRLEYDFVLAPGASPDAIALEVEGARGLAVDDDGDLVVAVPGGELRMHRPYVYQDVDGHRRPVDARYVLQGDRRVGFRVAPYDTRHALVIDPVLGYSTYLGGSKADQALGLATDQSGFAYVTGKTLSTSFPSSPAAFQKSLSGKGDVFVTKLDTRASGAASLVYSTYVGGSQDDVGNAIALDPACVASCAAYVTGRTFSTANFPAKPLKAGNKGGSDAFVFKLKPDGSGFHYSVYLGGSAEEAGAAIAVSATGEAYVTGFTTSSSFPATPGAYRTTLAGAQDAYLTRLDATGSAIGYSTYLGGSGVDAGAGVALLALAGVEFVYLTGSAASDFPVTADAYQASPGGSGDAFVAILHPRGQGLTDLVYSTYLGGSGPDAGQGIAVDGAGDAYVTGSTASPGAGTVPFPIANAYQGLPGGGGKKDAFVVRLHPSGADQLVYATYLGGTGDDAGNGIAVDATGNAYVTGQIASAVLPVPPPAGGLDPLLNGPSDAFVARFNTTAAGASSLVYLTHIGGTDAEAGHAIRLDAAGTVYVAGQTFSASGFPVLPGSALQGAYGGSGDAFVTTLTGVSSSSDAELSLTKSGAPAIVAPGGSLAYTLGVANNGTSTATGVTVSDALPAGTSFVSASGPGWTCGEAGGTVTCSAASLAVGPASPITITVAAPATAGTITNTATVRGNEIDPDPGNNVASVTTVVNTPPTATVGLAPVLARTNDILTATATGADADGDAVVFTYVWKVNGLTRRTVSLSPASSDTFDLAAPGQGDRGDVVTVEVTPHDGRGEGAATSDSLTVANSAPTVSASDQAGTEGVLLTFGVTATDPDLADGLTVWASDLPAGASFDPSTRTFTWTPNSAQSGLYALQFTASDGQLVGVKTIRLSIADAAPRPDRDGDGVPDDIDNCPDDPNPSQIDVCHTTSPVSAAVALAAPGSAGGSLVFNLNVTTGSTPLAWVAPGQLNGTVRCRIFDSATNTEIPGQRIPELGIVIMTDEPGGDLVTIAANTSTTLSAPYDHRFTHPDLPEGSYTFVCEYRNHTPAINPEVGEADVWLGYVQAAATTVHVGQYAFGGFSSPAPFENVNRGRALPFKFSLTDSSGAPVSTCVCRLYFVRVVDGQPMGPEIPATWKNGTPGNVFESSTNGTYQLNADTGPLAAGTWRGLVRLDDGTTRSVDFIVTGQ